MDNNIYKKETFTQDDIAGKDFNGCKFEECRFTAVNFRFSTFTKSVFVGCDLSSNILDITSFTDCTFEKTNLSNINWSGGHMKACKFVHSILKNSVFQALKPGSTHESKKFDLKECSFTNCDLTESIFIYCDLKEVDFTNAVLDHVVFDRCDLTGTSLTGASISGTNFETSKIQNTILDFNGFIAFGNSKGFVLEKED